MKKGKKVGILGAGNVGSTIAYTLTANAVAAEIVLIDINKDKAKGEAIDIFQGTAMAQPVNIYAGDYKDLEGADIVVITSGAPRKPGQSRIDLVQGNVNIMKEIMPQVVKYCPDAVYVVVSNPVDILTYQIATQFGLHPHQVIGTGTLLDTSRLRSIIAKQLDFNTHSIHAYVLGEHGDTSVIPWSLLTIGGMAVTSYCSIEKDDKICRAINYEELEKEVRNSGATVISLKGATYYAISLAVKYLCESIIRDTNAVMVVSGLIEDSYYGISDVCISLPHIVGAHGIKGTMRPHLLEIEQQQLIHSANTLKEVIANVDFK